MRRPSSNWIGDTLDASDSPDGALRFAVPRHALRFYFPALWPEAEQDEAFVSGAVGLPVARAKRGARHG